MATRELRQLGNVRGQKLRNVADPTEDMDGVNKRYLERFLTPEGGVAIYMYNATGAPSVKGSVITASGSLEGGFNLQTAEYEAVGVVYEDGIADGELCAVVVSGIAEVLLKDGTSATYGYWTKCADTNGRAEVTTPPTGIGALSVAEHFKEIGHCLQSVTAGTNKLCKIILHFN